ncbi:cytochrome P450 family protein [Streptosporangium sp. NBC_01756]|uniref:cytochrome P450 family protein n=1 Tax=Streptosporangium sp. NBC_01756 TaxID=2975950 RepID=UPI002DD8BF5A|nr:cytochrome P450 [Streptosporangium sp. NBC_01756]WSC89617.1 cytochrome P450 [Streptosporangium sp. NBC_01756]
MADTPFSFPVPGEPAPQTLAHLRKLGPVVPIELPGNVRAWAVTSQDAIFEVLSNDNKLFSRHPRHWTDLQEGAVPTDWPLRPVVEGEHLQVLEGADHRRLRGLISRAFTPSRVEALTPRIEKITAELLDAVVAAGDGVDLVSAFTEPLPISVISELFGVPVHDRPRLRKWTQVLISHTSTGEETAAANRDLLDYLGELVEEKRRTPGDDLTSGLVRVHDEGDRLTGSELVAILWLMIIAGHETTVHLLGNAVVALCVNPEQRALALAGDQWPQVVEEALRSGSTVVSTPFRYVVTDVTLAGVPLRAGEPLLVCYGGAATDTDRHGEGADRFDITREQTGHLAFGHGPHFCIGAPLARLESAIALSALFNRLPDLDLAIAPDEVLYSPSFLTYGPLALPVNTGVSGN